MPSKTSSRTVRKATKTTTATVAAKSRTKPAAATPRRASSSSPRRETAETARRESPEARRDGPDTRRDGPDFTRSTFWRVVMIHKALQNEEKFSSDTLAAELEVSSRTITRDIKLMQDLLGMPVEWDPGEHSFVYTRPCDTLPLLCLSRREALVFAVIAHVVNGWLGAALGSELDGIMKKITPAFGGAVDLDPDALQRVLTLPDAGDLHELDHFLPLLEALLAHEQVAIEYRKSATHPVERRRVDPLQLALQEGAWLLVTHDHAREEVRRFLLTRIRQVTRTGTTFEPPRVSTSKSISATPSAAMAAPGNTRSASRWTRMRRTTPGKRPGILRSN